MKHSKQALFKKVPEYKRKRIFGIENEYGAVGADWNFDGEQEFQYNGGRIYVDCGHIEYATPECSNPLEAVIYDKAGELLVQKHADKIYKNNIDSQGNTFGTHENYDFTMRDEKMIPFLVTRPIIDGSGRLSSHGTFQIFQRVEKLLGSSEIFCGMLSMSSIASREIRFHYMYGDANMNEVAGFLKLGTTGLVLDLSEDGALPNIPYDMEKIEEDLEEIAMTTSDWMVHGTDKTAKAVDIQCEFLKAAKTRYKQRDEITDTILTLWEDTLEKLDRNPTELVGRLDWVTKKALIDQYAESHNLNMSDPILRNIDLQYHDTDRERGLFYALQKQGKVERLTTDKMIEKATKNPPKDTRAYYRGHIINLLCSEEISKTVGDRVFYNTEWDIGPEPCFLTHCLKVYNFHMIDPYSTYSEKLKKARQEVKKYQKYQKGKL